MGIALYLATMLSFKIRFKNLFKGIIFFPYLINGVAISFIFLYVFKPGGVLDSLLAVPASATRRSGSVIARSSTSRSRACRCGGTSA